MKTKRILSLVLALCTVISAFATTSFSVSAAYVKSAEVAVNTELADTGADYGLADNIQDGNILHCFNWKYNDIKAELKNIAEAGFTSVQTSPAQPAGSGTWYWLYQPYGFYVDNNPLGSKSDLQALCTEADKYGIKVIVDVVANHLNGDTNRVQDDIKDSQYWHTHGGVSNWADRSQVIYGEIGMRDLNSEHSYVQQVVAKYANELKGIGVDGIRWDAAKHIGLPSENCNFWPSVTNNGMYHYGEILVGPDDRSSGNEHLMIEYTNYMSVTDSNYGKTLRDSFSSGTVPNAHGNWVTRGVADNKLVYWGESHDTWSNGQDWGFSNGMSQNVIDRAYAVAASRNGANALYFSRPGSANKESIHSGQKGSTHFTSPEVAAVNQLKNECIGEKDYYTTGNNCAVVCRESGAVIVAGSGSNFSVSVPNGGSTTAPGTYKDLVSGSTWTVTSTTISGQIGSSGIAVICNPKPAGPSASVYPDSKNYMTDTLELTLSFSNATSGQYSVNGGAYQSFTNGQKITVGVGTAAGTQATISVKASNGSTTSDIETYTYNKAEVAENGIYYDNSSTNWGSVNCYIYKNGQGYREWPGEAMTNIGDGIWYYNVPSGFENCQVIFSDNGNDQNPKEEGFAYSNSAMICQDGTWQEYIVVAPTPTQTPIATQTPVPNDPTEAPVPTQTTAQAPGTQTPVPSQATLATDPAESDDPVFVVPPVPTSSLGGEQGITQSTGVNSDSQKPGGSVIESSVIQITEEIRRLYGDVDGDDKVSIKDATKIQKLLAKLDKFDDLQKTLADVNASNSVSIADVTAIQKLCAYMISEFDSGVWYITKVTNTEVVTQVVEIPEATVPGAEPKTDPAESVVVEPTENVATQPAATEVTEAYPNTTESSADATSPAETFAPVTNAPETNEPYLPPVTEATQPTQTTEPPVEPTPDGMITVYFKNDYKWSDIKAYYWKSDGTSATTWPGESLTLVGGDYYKITIPEENVNIIFSDNGNYKTADLSIPGENKYYSTDTNQWHDYTGIDNGGSSDSNSNNNNNSSNGNYIYFRDTQNWNCAYAYTWGDSGEVTWPGPRMDYVEGNLFRIEVPSGHNKVVFNDGNDNRKTGDIDIRIGKAYNYTTGQWENV